MNLIDLSIRRTVFAWVLMFSLIVFGAISLNQMGISQLPDIDFPVLNISFIYEGAAPEVIEAELLEPIEQRLLSIEGIKEMRSNARSGRASINLEFDIERNVDVALQEVQSAISQFRLPPGVDPAVVRKENPEEDPILIVSIYGDESVRDMLIWVDNYLLDQLRFLPGVGQVSVGGFSERNLRIWVDTKRLREEYLTIGDIVEALQTQHLESAAGQFSEDRRELRVRWLGEATTPEEVGNIQLIRRGGQIIHDRDIFIKDVAKVEDGLSDIRRLSRVEGRPAVSIQVRKQRGTNEVQIAKLVKEKLAEIQNDFPPNYKYRINVDFTRSTESTVDLTIEKIWVAGIITILICFLFLGSIPAAINILFAIPTSIVGTFIILYFSGFTLNLFTLLALTLAISIVVDDAIMLLENIVRHYRMGKSSTQAASEGAKEVLPAATAATLAVIAVFLPVIFMEGVIGKFFFQFGVTMSAAVLLSLLEAITITPMRSAALLRTESKTNRFESFLDHSFHQLGQLYRSLLHWTLRWKFTVITVATVFFLVSLLSFLKVRQEFVPPQDQDIILLNAQTSPDSSLEYTNEVSKKIEEIIKTEENVDSYFVSVGGGPGAAGVNAMFIPITLKPKEARKLSHIEVMARLREKFKPLEEARITMRDNSARNLAAGRSNPIAINLRGPDLNVLNEKSLELMKRLEDDRLAVDLDSDYRMGIPELIIKPNRQAMADHGVSIEAVGQVLAAGVGGLRQGRYTADGRRYDIRFKFFDHQIQSPEDVRKLFVRNVVGNLIPLERLVHIEEQEAVQAINRINRQRSISVFGNLAEGRSQAEVLDRAGKIAREILPTGYSFALEGASAGFAESFQSLTTALLIGILVAYLILAVQFNSFVHPVSVLMALPFSVSGALMTLWGFDYSLNLFSFIGLIVLMGISKKNSILLVEFTNQIRARNPGQSVVDSLLEACPIRLRPIIMTSVATAAAALPLALGHGMGSEARAPMGLAIIGGTIVSTILTLFVVPALYLVLTRLEIRKRK